MYVTRSACLLLWVACLSYQLPSVAQINGPSPNQQSKSQKSNSTNDGVSFKNEISEQTINPQHEKPEDIAEKRLYHRYLRATIVGVCVSVLLFIALIWQNILTRKVAKAAQDSANAFINSERPWIIISSMDRDNEMREDPDDPGGKKYAHFMVTITFKNYGQTPAIIHRVIGGLTLTDSLVHEYSPLDEPESSQLDPILAPNTKSNPINFVISRPITEDEHKRLKKGVSLFLLVSGIVEYSDFFKERHISRFCYIWDSTSSTFRWLCHTNKHNEYT